jgi:Tol biopolymer transport system component
VTFTAQGTDRATGDAQGVAEVYLYDRVSKKTRLVSVAADGSPAAQASVNGEVSRGGLFVAFSTASALVPDDRNGAVDMYVRDVRAGTTERVSVGSKGAEAAEGGFGTDLSWNGRYATFVTTARLTAHDRDDAADVYRNDLTRSRTQLVSRGDGAVEVPDVEMSDDGRAVAIAPSPDDSSLLLLSDLERGLTTPIAADVVRPE